MKSFTAIKRATLRLRPIITVVETLKLLTSTTLLLAAVSAQSATVPYNFSGGLQGWTQIGTTLKNPWNSGGNAWGSSQAGSIFGYDGDDGAEATYWVRSPAFQLDGSGPLTVRFWGGKANTAAPANVTDVPANSIAGGGFKGVVLRDVDTGNYVKSLAPTGDGANANYSLSVSDLAAYANNGKIYTLEFLDYDHGGWGWVGLDNVVIPGSLMQIVLVPAVPAITIGGNSTVAVSIPLNVNATVAVTVYVTNGNPGAITINGSAASVVPVTFAAGAATSQNVAVAGTGLGYAPLTAGAAGLASGNAGLAVLPSSGLIGRWLDGSADLLDKSGYMPVGTHDGAMGDSLTAAFSADVPPGATGAFSLDLATSGGAVLITNTVTTDGDYLPTFDEGTVKQLSVAFWAKGLPGNWNPFVSKDGEGSAGWQVRKRGGDPVSTFTLRGTGGEDDPFNGSILIDDGAWHHFAATWDGVSGIRKLYVDGKLNVVVPHDAGPMGLAKQSYLALGGRCNPGSASPGNTFAGNLYDVQIYGLALSGSAVQSIFLWNSSAIMADAESSTIGLGNTGQVSVSIPASANAAAAVTVFVTNTTPVIASLAGAVANVATLTFPAGAPTSQTVTLTGLSEGQAQLACAATGLTPASASVKVYGPHLIGHWFSGTESFTNNSTFAPVGTHDGVEVGTVGNLTFTSDIPPSKLGKAAQFGGGVGLLIGNSSLFDPGYVPTFDDVIARQFSAAFWAKGIPGTWNAFISKRGDDAIGWQVRRGDGITEAFTLRGTGSGNEDGIGSVAINDGQWHHYAAVWDGQAGIRKCYVDGVLDPSINLTSDFAPMMMSPNHHLILGGREQGQVTSPGVEGAYNGLLYDVRMYNYPLTETEVKTLSFVAALKVAPAQRSLGAPQTMTVDVVLPAGANQSQAVSVKVTNNTPAIASLSGAVGNVVTLNYAIGGSVTQQVTVAGIRDGQAKLTATGGGFVAGVGAFNVWADPGSRLIGHWISGAANLVETSGFRPAGTHDGVAVGANAGALAFSTDVPAVAPPGAQSLDLSAENVAVMITKSSSVELGYVETFDNQIANKFSITCWMKSPAVPSGDWQGWVTKRGEDNQGFQVRRRGGDNPIRPVFTLRGTPGDDDPWNNTTVDITTAWHHFAATWDGATGVRKLYLDGSVIQGQTGDSGPMALAAADHLMLGAMDYPAWGGFTRFFPSQLYDVRVYSYALSGLEVGVIVNPPTTFTLALAHQEIPLGDAVRLVITVPASATASGAVTVYLTNNSPGVVTILGPTAIVFPMGSMVQTVNLLTIGAGQINITAGLSSGGSAALVTVNMVVAPKLIGHWLNGAADLTDKSGFTPAGTHDGVVVGANPEMLVYSADVPAGFAGQSLDLTGNATGQVGVIVTNSATGDGAYLPTFNDGIGSAFSVALWAKGVPGTWNGFVSKRGEDGIGWQMRRGGGDAEAFTIRGTASGNADGVGSVNITDGQWHHFAGVWDGVMGTRKCYVDGVLDPSVNLTGDFGPMSLAPSHHLGIGAREQGGLGTFDSWFNGKLCDVRIYNYPITPAEVASLVSPPKLTIQKWTGNQVRIAWPTTYAGFALQRSSALSGGWGSSGLSLTVEGSENVAYAPATGIPQFFRLIK